MPLNVRLTPAELTAILNHAEPRVVIYESDFTPIVDHLRRTCPAVQHWIQIGQPYEDLLAVDRLPRTDIFSVDETAIAELFYTSGSTGTPKGVMLSHRTLYLHAFAVMATFAHTDERSSCTRFPCFTRTGGGAPHSSVTMGLTQVMVRRFEPRAVLRLIQEERATGMALVPTMANALLNCPELRDGFDVSSMEEIMLGGAASSPELIARMEGAFPGAGSWPATDSPRAVPWSVVRAARAPSHIPATTIATAVRPWPAGRSRAARSASSISRWPTSRRICNRSAKWSFAAI